MSGVLDLPAVTTVPLGELLSDIRNGIVVEQEKELPGIPITRIETISKGTVDMGRVRYVRDTAGKNLENFWLKTGDILFSHINSDLHLGKTALVLSDAPLLHGMNLLRLRVDSRRLRPKYLHHWLDYCRRTGVFMAIAQHAVNQSSLNQKKITSLEVPLRSLADQDEIVSELEKQFSRLDEAVANLQRVKANLKRYKASVLKAAVEGHLVETEATLARREGRTCETGEQLLQRILEERRTKWAGKVKYKEPLALDSNSIGTTPEGWGWAAVEMVCESIVDCPHSTAKFQPNGYPCVDTTWMTTEGLVVERARYVDEPTYLDRISRLAPKRGDIVFAREGTIGTAVLIPDRMTPCLGQRVMLLRASPEYLNGFLVHVLHSEVVKAQYRAQALGSTVAHINVGDVKRFFVPVPPLTEQGRILAAVDRHLSIIREVEAEVDANLKRADALRQASLTAAFAPDKTTGRSS